MERLSENTGRVRLQLESKRELRTFSWSDQTYVVLTGKLANVGEYTAFAINIRATSYDKFNNPIEENQLAAIPRENLYPGNVKEFEFNFYKNPEDIAKIESRYSFTEEQG